MTTIPTLSQLRTNVQSNLETAFGGTIPSFGKNALRVISTVWAGLLWVAYKYLGFVQKNIFVDTADPESKGGTLERWGRVKLSRNPFTAVAAQYSVSVTGTIGAVINAKTTFKSNDDSASPGKMFIIDQSFTLTSSPDLITLRAIEPGVDSRLADGDELTATIPIANVNKTVEVDSELVQPLSAETTEEYREKIEDSFKLESNGGSAVDYRLWAADVQGVRQVYPYNKTGFPGELNVYIEATVADSEDGKGTPSAAMIAEVAAVFELDPDTTLPIAKRGRRPLGVHDIHELPVSIQTVDIDITGLTGLTGDQQDAIEDALIAMIADVRPFISAADPLEEKNDILDVNRIIVKILEVVPGTSFGPVDLQVNTISVSTFTFTNGQIPWVDTINFI